jgi:cation diffusion facilitator family transporter
MDRTFLTRFAWLSIAAAVITIGLKTAAWAITGSVGLLSDALESFVNLAGALMALAMLTVAARPADEEHPYGHTKAEYFSGGVEGILILGAAGAIMVTAVQRLMVPRPLEQVGVGLAVALVASLLNLGVGLVLLRAGRRYRSITLEANARHLLTDVWSSAGVLAGLVLAAATGQTWLDPVMALLVALHITRSGFLIVRDSVRGLMDVAWPSADLARLDQLLARWRAAGIDFHAIRTRQSGARRFISLHVLVPGAWSVQRGHELVEQIEGDIRREVENVSLVITHLEPLEDPISLADAGLDREAAAPALPINRNCTEQES